MNYRHVYHAGAFQDVHKHAILTLLLDYLKQKEKPFFVLDTHAGAGRYDLASPEALKTNEAQSGILRLWGAPRVPPELEDYLAAVRALNARSKSAPRWYPGSPRLVRQLLRPQDRLVAVELHADDAKKLAGEFRRDVQVQAMRMDGYLAAKSLLPPAERRGLVIIDPPFEAVDEFERLGKALRQAHRRWPTGIYAVWFPIKDIAASDVFLETVKANGIRRIFLAELWVEKPGDPEKLTGSALLIVNPPWTLKPALETLLAFLAGVLGRAPGAGWRAEWLVPE